MRKGVQIMREITVNLYRFDELTPEAQENAMRQDDGGCMASAYSSDYQATLLEFENVFGCSITNYSVNGVGYDYEYDPGEDVQFSDPIRFARYIWNRYADDICKGKHFSLCRYENGEFKYKSRRSNIRPVFDGCPLTGFCADDDILRPVVDCLHYRRFYTDIRQMLDDCLTAFFHSWSADIGYTETPEYFAEYAEANDIEFYADGRWYND